MTRKINLEKVLASLTTPCPKCGYAIPPNETRRISFTEMKCPKCQAVFIAGKKD
jgi:ribosomal protein S27AE